MDKQRLFPMFLNLQLFAEGAGGGDGGTGAEGQAGVSATAAVSQKGAKSNPLANVVYGKQAEAVKEGTSPVAEVNQTPTEDRNAKYEAFIKEHKDLDDARIQNIVQKRLKGSKETVEKYEALTPTLEILAKKYGVDASDIKALNKAIEEDDSYFEEEALEKGISVEQLKEIRKMERENSELRKQVEEKERRENANRTYATWMEQAEKTKAVYPTFDFRTEMQNQQFVNLIQNNVDVRTAYEVVHKDDIISGAMQFTAKQVEQKLANKIIAGGARPAENGNSSQSATVVKSDVSQLSKADRSEIIRRVQRGEKIRF